MGVSRPVLRDALKYLEQNGRLVCEPNRSRKIVLPSKALRIKEKVLVLVGGDHPLVGANTLAAAIAASLERKGMEVEIRSHLAVHSLKKMGFFSPKVVSVLVSVPESTQRWFCGQPYPAIVSGSVYPGVNLSSVDIDGRATARHAVGKLLRLGHRKIACILVEPVRAGDVETEKGFLEGFNNSATSNATPMVIRTWPEVREVTRNLRRILLAKNPPTALFICHACLSITAASFALNEGIRIPDQLSILSRDSALYLDFHYPRIASYSVSEPVYLRLLTRLVASPPHTPIARRLIPQFHPGESIGPCAGSGG